MNSEQGRKNRVKQFPRRSNSSRTFTFDGMRMRVVSFNRTMSGSSMQLRDRDGTRLSLIAEISGVMPVRTTLYSLVYGEKRETFQTSADFFVGTAYPAYEQGGRRYRRCGGVFYNWGFSVNIKRS